jgi:LacI family transcriptional regulator
MTNHNRPPTLEQIARAAGVSRSTVSRVVNNEPYVRTEVRERVWEVVDEMGYHPNAAARSLASRRSQILGIVIPRAVNNVFVDPFFPALLQGLSDAASERGYHLMLSMLSHPSEEEAFYRRALRSQMLDGLIISSAALDDPLIPRLLKGGFPFVTIGRHPNQPAASYVDVDNMQGARMAVEHLVNQGRRRIATITGPLETMVGVDRLEGYKAALRAAGAPIENELIARGEFTEPSGYAAMQRLLRAKPDAVFAGSDLMAMGALRALRQARLRTPEDVALIGFEDAQIAASAEPPLTTVRQPVYRLGTTAIDLLLRLVEDEERGPFRAILPTSLVIRASCGA